MNQYRELKNQVPDALLFFRMGDFYELFGEDAVVASQLLDLTLTSRDKSRPDPVPMAGVPHHSSEGYIQKLLENGRKVAIGEQIEDPATTKGIVRREIVRVFTPAVRFDASTNDTLYLACLIPDDKSASTLTLACLDPGRGECRFAERVSLDGITQLLQSLPIKHLLWLEGGLAPSVTEKFSSLGFLAEALPPNYLGSDEAHSVLERVFSLKSLDAFFSTAAVQMAFGILITYVLRTQKQSELSHIQLPIPLISRHCLKLGPRTAQHLDLLPSQDGTPSLFGLINRTRSALGARALKNWLVEPLLDPSEIAARQKAVQELGSQKKLSEKLAEVYDLERIAGRVSTGLASPRDTLALGETIELLPGIVELLAAASAPAVRDLAAALAQAYNDLGELSREILRIQKAPPPFLIREGGLFNYGVSDDLDRLLKLDEEGEKWLIDLESRERESTGISSLKVRYNRVFGYYIEITRTNLKSVPEHYQRKQSMANAERFFTEELKKFEDDIVTASARRKSLEQKLFEDLIARTRAQIPHILRVAKRLGELDALHALSVLAREPGWCFPQIDDSLDLEIRAGRHPLVDDRSKGGFVPNDLFLSPSTRLGLIITGPNMGGKSTLMRQVALIVILGQMGSAVPAASARWGGVSAIHTRIGAHDAIARGQSTFMVEMTELAHILHHADERSLIVLDEIGRGTSTFDGMSVAWATIEWIARQIRARTLFATHYHELTHLPQELPLLANAHMAVEGARTLAQAHTLRFLYELRDGATNDSFGIQVAKLAGLPTPVITRAWKVLEHLESQALIASNGPDPAQLSLFGRASEAADSTALTTDFSHPVLDKLAEADVDQMTPIAALNFLAELKKTAC